MEKKSLCKGDDSLMTVSAGVSLEINLPTLRTSTPVLPPITREEETQSCRITSPGGNAVHSQSYLSTLQKYRQRFTPTCNGNLLSADLKFIPVLLIQIFCCEGGNSPSTKCALAMLLILSNPLHFLFPSLDVRGLKYLPIYQQNGVTNDDSGEEVVQMLML